MSSYESIPVSNQIIPVSKRARCLKTVNKPFSNKMIYHTESRLNLRDMTARSNTKDEEIMVCFTAQFE